MKNLQVPYNWDLNILPIYAAWSDFISDLYFPADPQYFASARRVKFPENYYEHEERIIQICKNNNIRSSLLLNGSNAMISDNDFNKLVLYLNRLIDLGLNVVVISNPALAPLIRKHWPQISIRLSILSLEWTIGKIYNIYKLGYINEICVPLEFNRNEDDLKELRRVCPNLKISSLVTSVCRANCPLFFWHQSIENSTNSIKEANEIYSAYRSLGLESDRSVFKIPFILPSELGYYSQYYDEFKIEGRTRSTEELEKFLRYYALGINPIYLADIIGKYSETLCCPCPPDLKIKDIDKNWLQYRRNCKTQCWKECPYGTYCSSM